jgi:hypothetical protein
MSKVVTIIQRIAMNVIQQWQRGLPLIFLLLFGMTLRAEVACPKYRDGCLPLEHFKCSDAKDKDIQRHCYNERARYLIIWLGRIDRNTPYHYCDIGADVIAAFESAPSMYDFYMKNIRSKPNGEHGSYDCRDHPAPSTFD